MLENTYQKQICEIALSNITLDLDNDLLNIYVKTPIQSQPPH